MDGAVQLEVVVFLCVRTWDFLDERVAGTEALRVGAFYRVKLAKWPSCNIYWVTAPNPIMVARWKS